MTTQSVKRVFLKASAVAVLAGTLFAAAPKAQAQQFGVGVQFGAPAYGYAYGPGYYDHLRWEHEQARRDAWFQHRSWEHRDRGFYGYPPRAVPYRGGWR